MVLKFTVLGSGTSGGVPTISCNCPTCTSSDPRDKRLRSSLLIQSETTNAVIDTSADFRQQMIRAGVMKLDGVAYTHHHFDHIGGFDDIRAFNYTSEKPLPIYLSSQTFKELRRTFIYAFEEPVQIGGGVPLIETNIIDGENDFSIGDISFSPLKMKHGKLDVLGFKIGGLAYCTDTNYLPEETIDKIKGVDALVIDALRYHRHPTHFNVQDALMMIEKIEPRKAYLTHIAHQIKHSECEGKLPEGVELLYDGMEIVLETIYY